MAAVDCGYAMRVRCTQIEIHRQDDGRMIMDLNCRPEITINVALEPGELVIRRGADVYSVACFSVRVRGPRVNRGPWVVAIVRVSQRFDFAGPARVWPEKTAGGWSRKLISIPFQASEFGMREIPENLLTQIQMMYTDMVSDIPTVMPPLTSEVSQ
jgi:hypothetical protein